MRQRVLLLDEGFMSGAQTAVGLRDAACDVVVLAAAGGRGRHVGRGIAWSLGPPVSSAEFLSAVDDAVRRERIEVVYPLTEPIQQRIWDGACAWSELVFPPTEPWQRVRLRDKRLLGEFAGGHGVLVPEQCEVTAGSVTQAMRAMGTPAVIKGVRGRGGSATRIVHTPQEARAAVARIERQGASCFLQRYVPGATYLAGGVFDAGVALRLYTGVKRVQYPERTGPAAVIESVHDAALTEAARRLFALARVSGIASADFVRDADGRYLFLELNPRPWGSLTAAGEAGVDLFSPLADLLAGRTPAADLSFRPGVLSTVLPLYLLSGRCWRSGVVLRSLARDLRGPQGAVWRGGGQALHLLHRLHRVARNWPGA